MAFTRASTGTSRFASEFFERRQLVLFFRSSFSSSSYLFYSSWSTDRNGQICRSHSTAERENLDRKVRDLKNETLPADENVRLIGPKVTNTHIPSQVGRPLEERVAQ